MAKCLQMSHFIPWALYVALQSLVRRTQNKPLTSQNHHSPANSFSRSLISSPVSSPTSPIRHGNGDRFGASKNSLSRPYTPQGGKTGNGSSNTTIVNGARVLDAIQFLLSTLFAMKATNPFAKVLEEQINQELEGGEAATKNRLVGLASFPLVSPGSKYS